MKNSKTDQQSQKPLAKRLSAVLREQQGSLCSRPVSGVLSWSRGNPSKIGGIFFNDFSLQEDEIRIIVELHELGCSPSNLETEAGLDLRPS